jgi:mono/diheme cytochrome c family protein
MKKVFIIAGCLLMGVIILSCNRTRRNPGRTYMPDMAYSRAHETYSSTEELEKKGIHYNGMPVEGTMAQGDMFPYPYKNDSAGYIQSATVKNPLDTQSIDKVEAERLYLIYCGICHGSKLDGNGPLFNNAEGPYPAAPKNFMDTLMKAMPEGTMFHSATYGKNLMGSYASQLSTKQRWMVIAYIKSKQADANTAAAGVGKDTTATK